MTPRESAIIGAYTGVLAGPFSALHEYIEEIMGRPVFTHEMGDKIIAEEIKLKAKDDFIALAESVGKRKMKVSEFFKKKEACPVLWSVEYKSVKGADNNDN